MVGSKNGGKWLVFGVFGGGGVREGKMEEFMEFYIKFLMHPGISG